MKYSALLMICCGGMLAFSAQANHPIGQGEGLNWVHKPGSMASNAFPQSNARTPMYPVYPYYPHPSIGQGDPRWNRQMFNGFPGFGQPKWPTYGYPQRQWVQPYPWMQAPQYRAQPQKSVVQNPTEQQVDKQEPKQIVPENKVYSFRAGKVPSGIYTAGTPLHATPDFSEGLSTKDLQTSGM